VIVVMECSIRPQFFADSEIQFSPRGVVGRNDWRVFRRSGIQSGNGVNAFFAVRYLLNAALLPEFDECRCAAALRQ